MCTCVCLVHLFGRHSSLDVSLNKPVSRFFSYNLELNISRDGKTMERQQRQQRIKIESRFHQFEAAVKESKRENLKMESFFCLSVFFCCCCFSVICLATSTREKNERGRSWSRRIHRLERKEFRFQLSSNWECNKSLSSSGGRLSCLQWPSGRRRSFVRPAS